MDLWRWSRSGNVTVLIHKQPLCSWAPRPKRGTHHLKCQQSDSWTLLHSKDCCKEIAKNNQTACFNSKHAHLEAQMPQTCTWDYNLAWCFGGTESRSCGSPWGTWQLKSHHKKRQSQTEFLQGKLKNINFNINCLLRGILQDMVLAVAQQVKAITVGWFSHQTHLAPMLPMQSFLLNI